jgi:hypothetical protein
MIFPNFWPQAPGIAEDIPRLRGGRGQDVRHAAGGAPLATGGFRRGRWLRGAPRPPRNNRPHGEPGGAAATAVQGREAVWPELDVQAVLARRRRSSSWTSWRIPTRALRAGQALQDGSRSSRPVHVITTLNVQHVESVAERIETCSGFRSGAAAERGPDRARPGGQTST